MASLTVPDPVPPVSVTPDVPGDDSASPDLADLIHSLRQPLSTIEACAFYLSLVLPQDDAKCQEQVERIEQQVAEAGRILMEAARYVRADKRAASRLDSPSVT